MRVLITGGAGYLGSVLSRVLLETGEHVRVLDVLLYGGEPLAALKENSRFELIEGDVRDPFSVETALDGVDSVVHLAAIVGDPACAQNPALAREINHGASILLINAMQAAGVSRLVFASTCSNYGKMSDVTVLATEDHELRPLSLYAETKVAVERVLLKAANGLIPTILRFATLYGLSPRMRFDLTVNEFVMRSITERRLTVYGEQFWRPYVHVSDAARAIINVLKSPAELVSGRVFNVGSTDENYRKLDLVRLIQERIGTTDIEIVNQASDPRDYRVSFDRIKTHLGYQITRRVPDGMDEVGTALRSGFNVFSGLPVATNAGF
jgi:nucleoside-diphosphate-sugar epimerase